MLVNESVELVLGYDKNLYYPEAGESYPFLTGLKWVFNYVKILIKESNEKRDT